MMLSGVALLEQSEIRTEILSTLQYKVPLENVCQLDFPFKNITLRAKLRATLQQSLHFFCRSANVRFVDYLSFFLIRCDAKRGNTNLNYLNNDCIFFEKTNFQILKLIFWSKASGRKQKNHIEVQDE